MAWENLEVLTQNNRVFTGELELAAWPSPREELPSLGL